jgi:DNA-binding response OmpR family regulator
MVVDEDSRTREILFEYLRNIGYEPKTAADGAQALEMLRDGPRPAAMVCDAGALLDGFADKLRSSAAKLLVMTDRRDASAGLASIRKPFQLVDFGDKLLRLLREPATAA